MPIARRERLDAFAKTVGSAACTFAANSTSAVLILHESIRLHFYDHDLVALIDAVGQNLHSDDLVQTIGLSVGNPPASAATSLAQAWFHYYYSRLPLLLRRNAPVTAAGRLTPTREELDRVAGAAIDEWVVRLRQDDRIGLIPNHAIDRLPHGIRKGLAMSRWWVPRQRREDWLYDSEWLWEPMRKARAPGSVNVSKVTEIVIEQSFPIFWNSFISWYQRAMRLGAAVGALNGTRTVDELLRSLDDSATPLH